MIAIINSISMFRVSKRTLAWVVSSFVVLFFCTTSTWIAGFNPSTRAEEIRKDADFYRRLNEGEDEIEAINLDEEFWSPIELDLANDDPIVTLCRLNFKRYSESPHQYPMSKDLISMSRCGGSQIHKKMSALMEDLQLHKGTPRGRIIEPTGYESSCARMKC